MQIALHVLAYDVNIFINAMLRNAAGQVDKIYIAYPKRPFNYIPASRQSRVNPTRLEDIKFADLPCKVEVIEGDWEKEEETRNECLVRAKAEGFDWLITQDADEFYTEGDWVQIRKELLRDTKSELIRTTWYQFWKSSQFVVVERHGSIKGSNAGFALRCRPDLKFTDRRATGAKVVRVLDCPCYHYGYAIPDKEMFHKVTQWSHAADFDAVRWYNLKWSNWTEATVNLNVANPVGWKRAIRFPLHQPEFASEFDFPIERAKRPGLKKAVQELIYDTNAETHDWLRRTKRVLLG